MRPAPTRPHVALLAPSLFAPALLAALAACSAAGSAGTGPDTGPGVPAQGTGGERHYAVSGFTQVALGGSGEVTVRTGQQFGLAVTGDPGDLDQLKVTRDGATLGLGYRSGNWRSSGRPVRWTVTMPRIAGADIGGSGSISVDRAEGDSFHGNIGGSGRLAVGAMRVGRASFAIGGSGDIQASGTADALTLSVGGSGALRARGLAARSATITVAGAGDAEAAVHGDAKVTMVGSGTVRLTGGARCAVTRLGSGTVTCA